MHSILHRDTVASALLLSLGSEILTAGLLSLVLLIAHQPLVDHVRWFAICFLPPVLLLRHFASRKEFPIATKTTAILLFITFIIFMFLLFRLKAIQL